MSEPKGAEREKIMQLCHARARYALQKMYPEEYRLLYTAESEKAGLTLKQHQSPEALESYKKLLDLLKVER
jgi:hypothetical protein